MCKVYNIDYMKTSLIITPETEKDIVKDYIYNILSTNQLYHKYNIKQTRLYNILNKHNIERKNKSISEYLHKDIIKDYLNGVSFKMIEKKYSITEGIIYKILKINKIETKKEVTWTRKNQINENYFEIIDTEDKAYFLGLIAADGCVLSKYNIVDISLHHKDGYLLEKLSEFLCYGKNIVKIYKHKNGDYQSRLTICHKKIKQDLINLEIIPKKSLILKLTKKIPDDLFHHFVRGYFDGDGWICFGKQKTGNFYKNIGMIGSENFIKELVKEIKKRYNIILHINRNKNQKVIFCRTGQINEIIKFYNIIYKSNSNLFMKRKKERIELTIEECIKNYKTKSGKKDFINTENFYENLSKI